MDAVNLALDIYLIHHADGSSVRVPDERAGLNRELPIRVHGEVHDSSSHRAFIDELEDSPF
jgi:hypothetical protein